MKLSEVVSRAGLDLWTAQYVLRNPGVLARMPKAGSQGVHRTFTIDQAFRLAFTVRLIVAGIPLKKAARVVAFVDKHVTRVGKQRSCPSKYKIDPLMGSAGWTVTIYDRDFLRLRCGTLLDERVFYEERLQISTFKPTSRHDDFLERYEINLTLLQQRLESTS